MFWWAEGKVAGSMSANPPLTLAQAAALVGIEGSRRNRAKRMKRLILDKERMINRKIMLRRGGNGNGVRYTVTRWSLQRFMPELFSRRDELVEHLRLEIAQLRDRLTEHDLLIEHLGTLVGMKKRRKELPRVAESARVPPVG